MALPGAPDGMGVEVGVGAFDDGWMTNLHFLFASASVTTLPRWGRECLIARFRCLSDKGGWEGQVLLILRLFLSVSNGNVCGSQRTKALSVAKGCSGPTPVTPRED